MTRAILIVALLAAGAAAQESGPFDNSHSELEPFLERYAADRGALQRRHAVPMSPRRRERMRAFHADWLETFDSMPFEKMSLDAKVDWILFRGRITYRLASLDEQARRDEAIAPLLPFFGAIVDLAEAKSAMQPIDPRAAAETIDTLRAQVAELKVEETDPILLNRAADRLVGLRRTLGRWYRHYAGYDPLFTWWVKKPLEEAEAELDKYAKKLRDARGKGDTTLIGDPIGRAALLRALALEMIPYTPAELIAIATKEFAWCDAEMAKASRELGFDGWRKAQDHVKSQHVEPGKQPQLIRDLALEAIGFLDQRDLVTVPPLCRELWRMRMMSPERQKTSPYFLGGESIIVSYPTGAMSHALKLMSMRGNNRHFARATVHHELIPGHHLQGFMTARHRSYRGIFRTPFWVEGWALYWEMLLWDLGFPKSPEDRIGMLFWRKHRCARIIFSLRFHLKEMTAPEAVDFLVERVGHERNNAEAEVRRSVGGAYGPLYQAAYMLGGLQIRGLRRELVDSGRMTEKRFHDAILRQNAIPIELIRAALTKQKLARDFKSGWRFYPE